MTYLDHDIQTTHARITLAVGHHMTIQRWATNHQLHSHFSQAREEELLVCRWLRTRGKLAETSSQLERLLAATRKAGNIRLVLAIQVEMILVAAADKHKAEA